MIIWFLISLSGILLVLPLHFLSVEHIKLENKYGKEKGLKIGKVLGIMAGWSYFVFWLGIWISPQPRFTLPFLNLKLFEIPILNVSVSLFHFILFIPLIILGILFGITGVRATSLKVSENHRAEKIITSGIYSYIRHPQYFGGVLSHIGITLILSSLYSLISTPLIVLINIVLCWKEEKELIKEFGEDYIEYKKRVPMFFPKIRRSSEE
ncbi:MAG: methyltransferase family protein [Candidatus Thorarchaeota archaeon]